MMRRQAGATAIEFARAACYPETIADDVPDDYLARYFKPTDGRYKVAKPVRHARQNVMQAALARVCQW